MSKPGVKVRYYRLKNTLKDKTAGIALEPGAVIEFDEDILSEAEAAFEEMAEEYPDWVMGLIDQLFEFHRRCVDDDINRKRYFEGINAIAHDMRGQGGTFGYELITDFAEGLYNFTQQGSGLSDNHVEIIKAHLDAMRVVIRDRVNGDGGDIGHALKEGLDQSVQKYRNRE